jgi:hypothetical protein
LHPVTIAVLSPALVEPQQTALKQLELEPWTLAARIGHSPVNYFYEISAFFAIKPSVPVVPWSRGPHFSISVFSFWGANLNAL